MSEFEKYKAEWRLAEEQLGTRPRVTAVRHRKGFWDTAGRVVGVASCLLFMAAGTLFGHFYWGSDTLHRILGRHGAGMIWDGLSQGDPFAVYSHGRQFPGRQSLNVLILGVDYDYTNKNQIIRTAHGRSDAILVARVDFFNRRIDALTIPRDTAVRIPGTRQRIHKINAAHSIGGPDLTIQTIRDVFQIPIDAYCVINFDGFKKIVDAIGGIDLNVEKRLKYDDNWGHLHVNLYPGFQHLNGEQAMGYVRVRKSDSDFHRSKRQHAFLEAVRNKLKKPSTFLRLPGVVDSLNDMLKRGALSEDQMFALANFARELPKESINIETLPSMEGPSYVTCDDEKAAEVIRRLFYPYEYVSIYLDTPDPNYVRASGSRYDRTPRRRARRARAESRPSAEPAPRAENTELSVDEPAVQDPESIDPGGGSGSTESQSESESDSGTTG